MTKMSRLTTVAVLLFLMLVTFLPFALPVEAQSAKKTYAFIGANPNPLGVGQETLLHVGITQQLTWANESWHGITVTVTTPSGDTETLGPFSTDATGGTGTVYMPSEAGNYTFQTHFPEQEFKGVKYLASDSAELTVTVTEDPLEYYPGNPLPTEYWSRPIDSQMREWYTIAGSWLYTPRNYFVPYNEFAPDSAHILWTKELTTGGLAGGELGLVGSGGTSVGMETGDAYEGKFGGRVWLWAAGPIIINGKLYYQSGPFDLPRLYHCVDLHTGEELWAKTFLDNRSIAFGQLFYWESYNYQGTFAYLWVTIGNTWHAFNAFTGEWMFTIQNVPSGTTRYGPNGEIYRYVVDLKKGSLAMWNMTAFGTLSGPPNYANGNWGNCIHQKTLDAAANTDAARAAWSWNVTIPKDLPGSVQDIFVEDRIIGASISTKAVTSWALSLEEGNEGTVLFRKTWDAPDEWYNGNLSISWVAITPETKDGVFVLYAREQRKYHGFSTETGDHLWATDTEEHYLNYYVGTEQVIAYGKLISTGVSGVTYCYDVKTGELLWSYVATDPFTESLWSNDWWTKPMFVTDGKIYLGHMEHSGNQPLPRGAPFICLDMETGDVVWRADGLFRQTYWGSRAIIADSIIATMDTYDQRIYAIGKGPSATTVSAPDTGVPLGTSVIIKGRVTDISPGTDGILLEKRFPNGVPAVSDESMSDWMLYVYKQFERPQNATGVEVAVSVLDPNNNSYEVGKTTSDASGIFCFEFTPEVPGLYKIIATFEGTNSYWPSFDETCLKIEEAYSPTAEPQPTISTMTDTYVLGLGAGAIVAIIAIGLVIILMLRKR